MSRTARQINITTDGTNVSVGNNASIIGGANTTISTTGVICIGSSSNTTVLTPNNAILVLKDNPVIIKENITYVTPSTLSASDIRKGMIQFTVGGAYTLPSTVSIRNELYENTGAAFVGDIRPSVQVILYNSSVTNVTLTLGSGQTLANNSGSLIVSSGESKTLTFIFTSATTIIIDDMKSGTFSFSEPLFTTNRRAIISGMTNVLTNINADSFGSTVGGAYNTCSISPLTGGAIISGQSNVIILSGTGSASIGGAIMKDKVIGAGSVVVGGLSIHPYSFATLAGAGTVVTGGYINDYSYNYLSGRGSTISGGYTNNIFISGAGSSTLAGYKHTSSILSGKGAAMVGSYRLRSTVSGAGAVIVGGSNGRVGATISGRGAVTVGGYDNGLSSASISGRGAATIGGVTNGGTISGNGATITGGYLNLSILSSRGVSTVGGLYGYATLSADGVAIIGSYACYATISGKGATVVGSYDLTGTIEARGGAIVGGNGNTINMGNAQGASTLGGNYNNITMTSQCKGSVIISGRSNTNTLDARGTTIISGQSNILSISGGPYNGGGSVAISGNLITSVISGVGCLLGAGYRSKSIISGFGNAIIGSSRDTSSITGVYARGSVIVGSHYCSNTVNSRGAAVVGGCFNTASISDFETPYGCGSVLVGGTFIDSTVRGDGNVIAGSYDCDISIGSYTQGTVVVGGSSMRGRMYSNDGSVTIGGHNKNVKLGSLGATPDGMGCVSIGGANHTLIINCNGAVAIAGQGRLGNFAYSATGDNLVLIGGSNTRMYGSNSICIGPSTLTTYLKPTTPKLFVRDNPIIIKNNIALTSPATISAANLARGFVQFTTSGGAYTLPTTNSLLVEIYDDTASSFTGTIRPSFTVTFYNNSGSVITIATNTGQTFTNGSSPISIANNESRTWTFWFTSASAMLIEDMKSGTFSFSEPLFTTNSRAIISGMTNVLTNINSNSGGATVGGKTTTISISPFTGAVNIGGNSITNLLIGDGSVSVGGSLKSVTLNGPGAISMASSGTIGSNTTTDVNLVMINNMTSVMSGFNNVSIGSVNLSTVNYGLGGVTIGSLSCTNLMTGAGNFHIGGTSNIVTLIGNGSGAISGISSIVTINGSGGLFIGGMTNVATINGSGNVGISFSGTIGTNSSDIVSSNNVLIGGKNTVLAGDDSICIGPSNLTYTLKPLIGKLFLKDNPVSILNEVSTASTTITLTPDQFSNGYIRLNATGSFGVNMPTVANLYSYIIDSNATALTGRPRPSINTYFYNTNATAGIIVTLIANTGWTIDGTLTIPGSAGGTFRHLTTIFTSPTTAIAYLR